MREILLDKLKPIFSDVFDVAENEINLETTSDDISTWDSMNQVLLIATIEEEFGVRFPLGEFQGMKSVSSLLSELERML